LLLFFPSTPISNSPNTSPGQQCECKEWSTDSRLRNPACSRKYPEAGTQAIRTLRRATAVIGIVLVVLFVSFAVARTTLARANAAFIAAANLQTVTLMVDGIERRALVHLPPAYDGKVALPVVLMFHGNGGTAESVVKETGWVAKSDAAGFIVVFPEATRFALDFSSADRLLFSSDHPWVQATRMEL